MGRLLLGVMLVRAHAERAAGNENHLGAELGLGTASPLYLARNAHAARVPVIVVIFRHQQSPMKQTVAPPCKKRHYAEASERPFFPEL